MPKQKVSVYLYVCFFTADQLLFFLREKSAELKINQVWPNVNLWIYEPATAGFNIGRQHFKYLSYDKTNLISVLNTKMSTNIIICHISMKILGKSMHCE